VSKYSSPRSMSSFLRQYRNLVALVSCLEECTSRLKQKIKTALHVCLLPKRSTTSSDMEARDSSLIKRLSYTPDKSYIHNFGNTHNSCSYVPPALEHVLQIGRPCSASSVVASWTQNNRILSLLRLFLELSSCYCSTSKFMTIKDKSISTPK
jgi:hypothetical protein